MVRDLCMLISNKSNLKRMCSYSGLKENEVISKIIHFSIKDHFEEKFQKTALAWANENDDPISVSDLLNLVHAAHSSKEEGLLFIKQQLTNDKLLFWITRTYSRFYQSPACTVWTRAIIITLIQLGLSYFSFIFDIYTDIQLTNDYYNAFTDVKNHTMHMLDCALMKDDELKNQTYSESCFKVSDEYPEIAYKSAYFMTWASLSMSLFAYFIGIFFIFNTSNITEKLFRKENKEREDDKEEEGGDKTNTCDKILYWIKRGLCSVGVRIFWPFFHIYRKIRYETVEDKSSRRRKFIEFETIWIMVRTIEQGIEATLQLIIVLYLLVPYYDEIHQWTVPTTFKKTASGVLHFILFGNYPACILEKVLGKLFLNVLFQSLSMAYMKYMKYGMSVQEHIFDMIPIFISYFLQISARLYALRALFVTAEELFGVDDKGLAIGLFFMIHFLFTFAIKFTFVPRRENFCIFTWENFKFWLKFIINFFSSSMIYVETNEFGVKPRCNIHEHNSFLPQTLFQLLILLEHLVITLFPLGLVTTDCLDQHTYTNTSIIVSIMWMISNMLMVFHYKNFHTWSQTNGPSFSNVVTEDDDILCSINTTKRSFLRQNTTSEHVEDKNNSCFQNLRSYTRSIHESYRKQNPEMSCISHLAWKDGKTKFIFDCFCRKTCCSCWCGRYEDVSNPVYKQCDDDIEMNTSRAPLIAQEVTLNMQ